MKIALCTELRNVEWFESRLRSLFDGDGQLAIDELWNEIQLAHTNYAMMPEIETVFLATAIKWSYLSSTIVREAAHYGQDVSRFVPRNVERALIAKREAGEL